jgi:hypothetical protein
LSFRLALLNGAVRQEDQMKPRLMLLLLASMLVPAFAFAQTAELLSQAKKEGEVILYTTMTVGDFQLFNKIAKEKTRF